MSDIKTMQEINGLGTYMDNSFLEKMQKIIGTKSLAIEVNKLLLETNTKHLSATVWSELFNNGQHGVSGDQFNDIVHGLLRAQEFAKLHAINKVVVACMPKSGSSFLSTAFESGLGYKRMLLNSSRTMNPSAFGVNNQEQTVDELVLTKNCIRTESGGGFVSQIHLKGDLDTITTLYAHRATVLCTMRNIFDGIVSLDDMITKVDRRGGSTWPVWYNQPAFKVPLDYIERSFDERIEIIALNYGTWCIDYFLSWKRLENAGIKFLWVDYSRDLSRSSGNKTQLAEKIAKYMKLSEADAGSLREFMAEDDADVAQARLNVGIDGRGGQLPDHLVSQLSRIASHYRDEMSEEEFERYFTLRKQ